jgi:DUF4097 and DUF4098 domain-containing protein YvlB
VKPNSCIPLLLAFAVAPALADTPISLEHTATPTAHIQIRNVKGAVRVTAWDRNQVEVTGRLGDGSKPLAITGGDSDLAIKVEPQGGKSGWFSWNSDNTMSPSTLEVHVPRAATLDVGVVSATVTIDGLEGGKIAADTVSGRVQVNARTPSLDVQSVSGSIELAGHADSAELQTVSGDILAPSLGNHAALQTVSGRIQATGGPWRKVEVSTVSGDLQLAGDLAPEGTIDIDSMSGDVQLQLPAAVSASIHASSFSGDLRSDFGTPREHEHGPGSELDTQAGTGSGKIHAETFSGDLRIRKGS